jgi:hypothetical protein
MTPDQKPQFAQVLAALGTAFDKEIDALLPEVYWRGLEDLDLADIREAALELLKTSEFFPRVSAIRQLAEGRSERRKIAQRRAERDRQQYSVGIAWQVFKQARAEGKSEAEIYAALAEESQKAGVPLYWPGEEPWNKPSEPERVSFGHLGFARSET